MNRPVMRMDFSSRPRGASGRRGVWSVVVMVLLVTTLAHAGIWLRLRGLVNARGGSHRTTQMTPSVVREEVAALNSLVTAKRFGWSRFLARLEALVPTKVSIESVAPVFERGDVHLTGLAASEEELVTLVDRLHQAPWCSRVQLADQRWQEVGGQRVVVFSLVFSYREDAS